ncbi:leucine-rich repeats and immunoglobulin-like domains protein 1 [Penaeus chinensis]|uniref:leucine-rich repeats and immunoglobulin-like domains protein 1 n=1 Tax=Penaeus chinensis TaxID=139456 RepID=UPI001FB7A4ED|nr:leucine-rich repeats and immunoglobulin-like domains protein 1 [Penaeus chinensis]
MEMDFEHVDGAENSFKFHLPFMLRTIAVHRGSPHSLFRKFGSIFYVPLQPPYCKPQDSTSIKIHGFRSLYQAASDCLISRINNLRAVERRGRGEIGGAEGGAGGHGRLPLPRLQPRRERAARRLGPCRFSLTPNPSLTPSEAPWWPAWKNRSAGVGVWARAGRKARLECRARAAPTPTVQWHRQSDPPLYSNYKYHIQGPQLLDGLVEWKSVLEVRSVAPQDFGNYTCTFRNPLGSFASVHALSPPPKPAVPRNFTVKGRESVSIREEVPEKGIRVPSFLLILLTLAGTVLVALNCVIIFCFVCRRAQHPRAAQANQQKIQEKVFSISSTDETAQESDPAVTSSYDVMHKMASCQPAAEEYQLTSLGGDAVGRISPPGLLVAADAPLPEAAPKGSLSWRDESVIPPDVCPRNLESEEQDLATGRPYDSQSPPSRPSSPENHSDPSSQFHLSFNPSDSNSPSRVSGILLRDLAEEKLTAPLLSLTPRSHSLHHCSLAPLQHAWERHHQSHHSIPSDSDVLLLRSQLGVELTLPRSTSTAPRVSADAATSRPSTSRSPGLGDEYFRARSSSVHLQTSFSQEKRATDEEGDFGISF